MEIKSKPDVRFPGFNEDWKEYKADSIFYSVSNKNYPELPVLSASQEKGMVFRKDVGINIQYDKSSTKTYKRVMPGQFVIHLRSFQGGFAFSDIEGITSPAYTVIDFKNKDIHNSLFWKSILTSKNFIKRLETVTYGIRDGRSISFNDFATLKFKVPNYNEQLEISSFFKTIDDLLTYCQQELEMLKQTKQGFLHKMLPKEGNSVPEIRFTGLSGEWEKQTLGNHITAFNEKTTKNNQYPILTSSRRGLFLQTDYYKGNQIASQDNTGYNIVPRGYFTYRHMSDDEIFKFNINNIVDFGSVSTLYPVFTTKNTLDSQFLKLLLNEGNEFRRFARLQKQGGSRTYMYLSKLINLKVRIPMIEEQRQIGNFFKQLDEVIALHQQELDALKYTKKAFLQKMFV